MNAPTLTPYDTGDRLEPKPWPVATRSALGSMDPEGTELDEQLDRFGRVDFENDESTTALTVHTSYDDATGMTTVHITPMAVDCDQIAVVVHSDYL